MNLHVTGTEALICSASPGGQTTVSLPPNTHDSSSSVVFQTVVVFTCKVPSSSAYQLTWYPRIRIFILGRPLGSGIL
ncbi:hypothetical protein IAQ61_006723 [Plenodomus lingam]|uniref:uncharacterized protein n=1 Tax=Leptosphaeria maculans TaxID=5022 RepID=UPI00332028B3|nr:hypothetical protein IAQ61_006723 [Plenodomus lingam]